MTLALISIAADSALRTTLDGAARNLGLAAAIHLDNYVSAGGRIDYESDPGTLAVVFIALDQEGGAALETAKALRVVPNAHFQIVLASEAMDMGLMRKLLLAGEDTLLPLPATAPEVVTLLNRLSQKARDAGSDAGGRIILFAGVNGGAGTTTLATHTAVRLAEEGKRTLLVDGRRKLGHAGLYLGLSQSRGSLWTLAASAKLDDSLVASFVVAHSSGLDVLCSASQIEEDFSFTGDSLGEAMKFLKAHYDFVLADVAASEETTPSLIAAADMVLFVATAEVAPLRDLTRWSSFYGAGDGRFHSVITHLGRGPITARHIEQTSGLPMAASLPELNGDVSSAINAGELVDGRVKEFYGAINSILDLAAPRPAQQEEVKSGWRKWIGR